MKRQGKACGHSCGIISILAAPNSFWHCDLKQFQFGSQLRITLSTINAIYGFYDTIIGRYR